MIIVSLSLWLSPTDKCKTKGEQRNTCLCDVFGFSFFSGDPIALQCWMHVVVA